MLTLLFCHLIAIINGNSDHNGYMVSFQPAGYYLPTGWIEDTGSLYSERKIYEAHTQITQMVSFGWNKYLNNLTWHIDVESITYAHKFIETGITLNPCDLLSLCDIWNIKVQNGFYFVEIGIGQPPQNMNQSFAYTSTIVSEKEQILSVFKDKESPSKWLHIGSKVVQVTDQNLTIEQSAGSFGTNIDYVIIKRIECGNITEQFTLPMNTQIKDMNYSVYYPSTVPVACDVGYKSEFVQSVHLKCNLDGQWMWEDQIKCVAVECGTIDDALLAPYDAHVYWQEYTDYNSIAIVNCNSKDVRYVGELICRETGQWKWKNGVMQFRCPSFTPMKNIKASVFSQYLEWFIAIIIFAGLTFIFACLHLHSYLFNKYKQRQIS